MWADLRRDPWARNHLEHLVWLDDDRSVLSSLKRYRPRLRVLGRESRATVIASVFTPAEHRGRGHASALLRAEVAEAAAREDALALLFSDIGARYYETVGFRMLPCSEAGGTLRGAKANPPPGWSLRPMTPGDVDAVRRAHADGTAGDSLALVRDAGHWGFLLARARGFYARLDGSDFGTRYRVAEYRGRFAGYVVAGEADGVWNVRECGAPGADPEAIGAILRVGAAQAARAGARKVYLWPGGAVRDPVPEWRLRVRPRRHSVPMVLPIEPIVETSSFVLSSLDQF